MLPSVTAASIVPRALRMTRAASAPSAVRLTAPASFPVIPPGDPLAFMASATFNPSTRPFNRIRGTAPDVSTSTRP